MNSMRLMPSQSVQKSSRQTMFLAAVLLISGLGLGYVLVFYGNQGWADNPASISSRLTLKQIPFDGAHAYEYLKELCALGPRYSGSEGMLAQQKRIFEHFQQLG